MIILHKIILLNRRRTIIRATMILPLRLRLTLNIKSRRRSRPIDRRSIPTERIFNRRTIQMETIPIHHKEILIN